LEQTISALYLSAIERSSSSSSQDDTPRDIAINDTFTYMLYANICRSLFAEHRLLWSLLLCTSILRVDGCQSQKAPTPG
jgi:dynein heavy chain